MRQRLCKRLGLFAAIVSVLTGWQATSASADDQVDRALLKTFVSELVEITPGKGSFPATFRQGDEAITTSRPVREVRLAGPFSIAKNEVPQNLYQSIMGNNPSRWKGPRNSVERMTWTEANEFCRRLTLRLREAGLLTNDEVIRLPTESEWEYCCRAGTTTSYSFGDQAQAPGDRDPLAKLLDPFAWHTGNAAGNDPEVGVLKPNPWGLYDMHGYLWEYCSDEWSPNYDQAPLDGSARTGSGTGTDKNPLRVLRGGSWKDHYSQLRCASRREFPVEGRDDAVGFRCVKVSMTKPTASAQ